MEELKVQEELLLLHGNRSRMFTNSNYSLASSDTIARSMFETALFIDKYYTPLLCLFGALGNSLSLAVFCMDAKYGSQSSSFYLSALAVSDTGFLLNVFVVWLEGFYGGVITFDLSCPLVMYLGQVTCFMSIYLTVAFSIERFVAVHYPFSRPRICTRSKAKKVIAGITLVALVLFSYVWIIAQVVVLPDEGTLDYEVKDMGHFKNATNNELSGIHAMTELTFPRNVGKPPQSPFYKNQRNQAPYFDHQHHQKHSESLWPKSLELIGDDLEYPQDMTRTTTGYSSTEILLQQAYFPSYSEQNFNFTDDDDEKLPQNLNIDHQHNEAIDSSSGVRRFCTVPAAYHNISEIANYIDSVLTLVLPFFLIAFFNVRIAMTVWKLKDQRRNIVATATTSTAANAAAAVPPSSPELSGYYHDHNPHRRQCTFRCNKTNSMDDDDSSAVLYRNPARSIRSICCLLNLKNGDTGLRNDRRSSSSSSSENSRYKRRGSSSVRFRDCIEMSEMESTIQGTSTLVVSHNLIQSSVQPLATSAANNGSNNTSPRFCIVRRKKSTNSSEVRVTKTLLLVSLVFVLLNLPAHFIRCAQFIQVLTGTQEGQELLYALQPWANILFNTNFAVNFLLYCVSGRNFRNSLKNVVLRKCRTQSGMMAPRFSWASDRSNKRFKNSCNVGGAATASTVVPSMATLADVNVGNDNMFSSKQNGYANKSNKCTPSTSSSLRKYQQTLRPGRAFCRYEVDDDDELEEKEETTAMFLAFSHESCLNYCDEDPEDNDMDLQDEEQDIDGISSV